MRLAPYRCRGFSQFDPWILGQTSEGILKKFPTEIL